jgi:hypothetical protein
MIDGSQWKKLGEAVVALNAMLFAACFGAYFQIAENHFLKKELWEAVEWSMLGMLGGLFIVVLPTEKELTPLIAATTIIVCCLFVRASFISIVAVQIDRSPEMQAVYSEKKRVFECLDRHKISADKLLTKAHDSIKYLNECILSEKTALFQVELSRKKCEISQKSCLDLARRASSLCEGARAAADLAVNELRSIKPAECRWQLPQLENARSPHD